MTRQISASFLSCIFLLSGLFFVSCGSDDEPPTLPNQEEVVTTLRYSLTPENGGEVKQFIFQDIDGEGGQAPVISVDTLMSNTIYIGRLDLLNETVSPVESISEEVEEEGDEHQFFFIIEGAGISISYEDEDSQGLPIGLNTKLETSASMVARLTVILRHEPAKEAPQVNLGVIDNAGGETDIEVTFDFVVL